MIALLPVFFGFIMEYLTSSSFGFYILPAAILSGTFYILPFIFKWLNMGLAFLAALFFLFFYAVWLLDWNAWPSYGFLYHAIFYLFIIAGLTYAPYALRQD